MDNALAQLKNLFETAITTEGQTGVSRLIKSSTIINLLHEVVKVKLIDSGVNPDLIRPQLGLSHPELKLAGFLKFKTQDVCVIPNHLSQIRESLDFSGLHTGKEDPYGELFTEHILAINLRSQLSSLGKNVDTMFERTYAEPLNLHRRVPKMVLGEVYLLAAREFDDRAVRTNNVVYKPVAPGTAKAIENYIHGFTALNNRRNQRDDDFKYERVALIIADFSTNPVKLYRTSAELKADGLLPTTSTASLEGMTFEDFIPDLIRIYERRFGTGKLN